MEPKSDAKIDVPQIERVVERFDSKQAVLFLLPVMIHALPGSPTAAGDDDVLHRDGRSRCRCRRPSFPRKHGPD
jgi:hypothetical protein